MCPSKVVLYGFQRSKQSLGSGHDSGSTPDHLPLTTVTTVRQRSEVVEVEVAALRMIGRRGLPVPGRPSVIEDVKGRGIAHPRRNKDPCTPASQ